MIRGIGLFYFAIWLAAGAAAQPAPEGDDRDGASRLSRSSEIIVRRDVRIGVAAGTSGEVDGSLTVRSRFLGPFSARVGGSLGLSEYAGPLVGAFAISLGMEGTSGRTSTGLWISAWRQTTVRPPRAEGIVPTGNTTAGPNMLSVGGEVSYRVDARTGLYTGLRVYVWDDRMESSIFGGAVRVGTRIRM